MYLSGPPRGRGAMSRSGGSLRGPSPSRGRSKGRGGSGRDDDRGFRGPPLAGAFARLALCDVTNPCPRVSLPPPPPHFLAEEWIARLEEGRCCCGNRANRRAGLVQGPFLCHAAPLFGLGSPTLRGFLARTRSYVVCHSRASACAIRQPSGSPTPTPTTTGVHTTQLFIASTII